MFYKKILYIDKADSTYTRGVKSELLKYANQVDCYFHADLFRTPIFLENFGKRKVVEYKSNALKQFTAYLKTQCYDFILIKSPYVWPLSFFEELSTIFKNTPIVNYNWSSVRMKNILPYREFFTKIYSFDGADCKHYGFEYYPLFFLHEFSNNNHNIKKQYDISFIGTGYSAGRLSFMNQLVDIIHDEKLLAYLYFYTPGKVQSLKLKIFNSKISNHCYWQQLSINEVINIGKKSIAVIDHPMSIQTGLTIRTFETLAAGNHLFTTNSAIVNEPFYDAKMITVIDSSLSGIKKDKIVYREPDQSWMESFTHYRIDKWVEKIITL